MKYLLLFSFHHICIGVCNFQDTHPRDIRCMTTKIDFMHKAFNIAFLSNNEC